MNTTATTLFMVAALVATPGLPAGPEDADFFENNVRPVLAQHCFECHDATEKTAGLDLSSAEGFRAGGDNGALVSREDPSSSRLLQVLRYQDRIKMPPSGRLRAQQLADLEAWVETGARWPGAGSAAIASNVSPSDHDTGATGMVFTKEQLAFWFFQPIRDAVPPTVQNQSWIRNDIDRFILSKLESEGLEPAPAAPPAALLRRATFDLTGLPPTPEQSLAFISASDSGEALAAEVDRLLASKRYGERYGRHWLDVARYADSTGNDEDHRYPWAYRYRDYVIQSLNQDMPYDQFVREQIAGDLLPAEDGSTVNARGIVATGFLALGPKAIAQQDKQRMLHDVWDEQVDLVSRAFMGLTVACARCHDHKFDPIPTKDYYGLLGMFASTQSFEDPSTHVSRVLVVPLVEDDAFEAWQLEQRRISYQKLEIAALTDTAVERKTQHELARVAESMMAAHAVSEEVAKEGAKEGAKEAEAVASAVKRVSKRTGLEASVLRRWVEYLSPQEPVRPHLVDWHDARDHEKAAVAEQYEQRFSATFNERRALLEDWRIRMREAAAAQPLEKPPVRPVYAEGRYRFYHEVYTRADGPLGVASDARAKLLTNSEKKLHRTARKRLQTLVTEARPRPAMACAVQEGETVDQHVLIRGDYHSPGQPAPKQFPSIVAGLEQTPVANGSGRRELAEWLVAKANPLTARVMMNRLWAWHFGEGLVRSPNNFGRLGDRPSHPELLDWLASRFVESGWSIKTMNRLIMDSNAYRMSSTSSDDAYAQDPANRLLARFPRRRLDVEEIRDSLLQIGGNLNLAMGGTLQEGFGTDSENSNDRLSLRPEHYDRRTVYLPLRRSNLPSLLNLFDFGDAVTTQGKRQLTNVAPQALFMMNSDFVQQQSKELARSLLQGLKGSKQKRGKDGSDLAQRLYLTTLNRLPSSAEADALSSYVEGLRSKEMGKLSKTDAWASASRILMSSNEFIYVD